MIRSENDREDDETSIDFNNVTRMPSKNRNRISTLIRLSIIFSFVCHGIIAGQNSNIVGAIDFLCALGFCMPKVPPIAVIWTCIWGIATAASRLYFLETPHQPYLSSVGPPFAEFFQRAPTWILPMSYAVLFGSLKDQPRFQRYSMTDFCRLGVAGVVFALALHYVIDWNINFPLGVTKKGMAIWYFYLGGSMAIAAAMGAGLDYFQQNKSLLTMASPFTGLAALVLSEFFEIFFLNAPHGLVLMALTIGEHLPIYFVFWFNLMRVLKPKTIY